STQPATLVVAPGGSATLAVAASGSGPLVYEWLHDGAPVTGQAGAVYHFASVSALDAGAYQVRVSNALGEVTSAAAQLLVVGSPAVSAQPASVSVADALVTMPTPLLTRTE
ncbi:MAG TPA: immunoglobulin domain-containing protein, partial [Rhizobacter sp.]|nr:immunoglobulin domain-containing protein [Rhizobacter sp.]